MAGWIRGGDATETAAGGPEIVESTGDLLRAMITWNGVVGHDLLYRMLCIAHLGAAAMRPELGDAR